MTNDGKDTEKGKFNTPTTENGRENLQKNKNRATILSSNPTAGCTFKRNEISRTSVFPCVLQHYAQELINGNGLSVHQLIDE
jgi:hypothetical protein